MCSAPALRVEVLGAAAGGGSPQWNCRCAVCQGVRRGQAPPRTQTQLAVSADGVRWALVGASPDLRQQLEASPRLWPREGVRHTPVGAVVLLGGDIDHIAGLLTLRERSPFALYAAPPVLETLSSDAVFGVLDPALVPRRALRAGEALALCDAAGAPMGLRVRPFAAPGKVALYLEDPEQAPELERMGEQTLGLEIEATGDGASPSPRVVALPSCAALPAALRARIEGAALLLFDGTLWRDDELIAAGAGHKSGRRMGHLSLSGSDGTLAQLRDVTVGRRVLIHLNNTNPALLPDSPERRQVEAAGWEVAHDGLEIALP